MAFKRLHPAAITPVYATDGSGCFDIAVHGAEWSLRDRIEGVALNQHRFAIFRTGLSFEIPPGFVMQVFSRSGHGFKNNVRLANCVGIIDSDYRGELAVKLTSDWGGVLTVKPGDRIAQAMVVPIPHMEFEEVQELSDTARGDNGFGSTGA